jgi:hypothetical protein
MKNCIDCKHFCHFPDWDAPLDVCMRFSNPGTDSIGRKNGTGYVKAETINSNHSCPEHSVSLSTRIFKFLGV